MWILAPPIRGESFRRLHLSKTYPTGKTVLQIGCSMPWSSKFSILYCLLAHAFVAGAEQSLMLFELWQHSVRWQVVPKFVKVSSTKC
jgi:hypothetical protein